MGKQVSLTPEPVCFTTSHTWKIEVTHLSLVFYLALTQHELKWNNQSIKHLSDTCSVIEEPRRQSPFSPVASGSCHCWIESPERMKQREKRDETQNLSVLIPLAELCRVRVSRLWLTGSEDWMDFSVSSQSLFPFRCLVHFSPWTLLSQRLDMLRTPQMET